MGRHFPVREFWTDWKSQGKVRENHTKYLKTQGIWNKYYLIFDILMIFRWTVYYLLKWIKFSVKKNRNIKKILEKSGILSVQNSGNPVPASDSSHSRPMDTFLFHRNCTSWSHGMAGNREAGGFEDSAAWASIVPNYPHSLGSLITHLETKDWIIQILRKRSK